MHHYLLADEAAGDGDIADGNANGECMYNNYDTV